LIWRRYGRRLPEKRGRMSIDIEDKSDSESKSKAAESCRTIIDGIEKIPTLPAVLSKLLTVLEDPKSNIKSVSRLIGSDPAMTARILKIVNSAYYGFPREISTVDQAIVILGFNAVKSLALSATVVQIFGVRGEGAFDLRAFWEHSIGTGVFADMLARRLQYPLPEEVFCAAVLHGIGKVILDQYLHALFIEAVAMARSKRMPLERAERAVCAIDHCQVGAMLAERWKLPLQIQESIRFYPAPPKATVNPFVVSIVHVGHYIAREMVCGDPGDRAQPRVSEEAKKILKISSADIDDCLTKAKSELSKAEDVLAALVD